MKEENKKPILSKRVIICLVVASFLVISAIFIAIISREGGISSTGSVDDPLNESDSSETFFPWFSIEFGDNEEDTSETKENGDEIDLFSGGKILGLPFWIWMIVFGIIASRIFFRNIRLLRGF